MNLWTVGNCRSDDESMLHQSHCFRKQPWLMEAALAVLSWSCQAGCEFCILILLIRTDWSSALYAPRRAKCLARWIAICQHQSSECADLCFDHGWRWCQRLFKYRRRRDWMGRWRFVEESQETHRAGGSSTRFGHLRTGCPKKRVAQRELFCQRSWRFSRSGLGSTSAAQRCVFAAHLGLWLPSWNVYKFNADLAPLGLDAWRRLPGDASFTAGGCNTPAVARGMVFCIHEAVNSKDE